jgi:hypothetical protein
VIFNKILSTTMVEGHLECETSQGSLKISSAAKETSSALQLQFSNGKIFRYCLRMVQDSNQSISWRKLRDILRNRPQLTHIKVGEETLLQGGQGSLSINYVQLIWQFIRWKLKI